MPPRDPFTTRLGSSESGVASVYLFGWVGSSPKLLSKYADALATSPLVKRVLHTTAPTFDVFLNASGLSALARTALDEMLQRPEEAVILMLMSNGGVLVYLEMLKLLQKERRRYESLRIVGTIFDSAPAYLTHDSMSRAPTEGIKNPILRRFAYWMWRIVLIPFLMLFVFGLSAPTRFWDALMNDPLPCPSLYIYSMHDLLTDPQRVDELVEARQRQRTHSNKIFSLKILDSEETSPHVMHFLKHPDRYSRSLHDFIKYAVSHTR